MSMYIGVSGLKAATIDLNTTAHNVANAGTTGFKNSRAEFGDLVASGCGSSAGIGVSTQAVNQLFSQGSIITTSKSLDLAITGCGFFTVQNLDSTGAPIAGDYAYTRAGSFNVAADGKIVNNLGQQLVGTGGNLEFTAADLPLSNLIVNGDGTITATKNDGTAVIPTGDGVGLVDFPNPQGLKPVGDTQWVENLATSGAPFPGATGAPTPVVPGTGNLGNLMSGALEASTVDLTDQLVNMIIAQRNFTANSKTITTNQGLTETVTNMIR